MIRLFIAFAFVLCVVALGASGVSMAYTPRSLPPPTKNVYETIATSKNLEKFTDMIDEAGLKDLLTTSSGEPVTVFAPSDSAMEDIPRDTLKRIEASKASLQSFVKYHVIAGSMVSSGAIKGRRASPAAANGEALSFDGSDRTKPPKVGDGELVQADIVATNGVVHIVSGPLVPPSLMQAALVVAQPAAPKAPVAPAAPTAASATTSGTTAASTPAAATTSAKPSVRITTSGVAKAPSAASTTITGMTMPSIDSSATAMPSTTSMAGLPPPAALPATTSSKSSSDTGNSGFELFGHKFSW